MAAESTTEDAQVSEPKTPRKGDFKKGREKTGGKRPPIPKLSGKAAREYLREHSNALEVLVRITRGMPVKVGGPTGKKNVYHYPDWNDVRWATEIALRKLVPDLQSQELVGDVDNPVALQVNRAMRDNPRELARRLELLLTSAGLGDAVGAALAKTNGAGAAEKPVIEAQPIETAEPVEAPASRPEVGNDPGEPAPADTPRKPGAGQSAWFAVGGEQLEIRRRPTSRPGDEIYTVVRGLQDLRTGSWDSALALVEKLLGSVPRATIKETKDPRIVSPPARAGGMYG
jgi:hypothetical protein